MWWGSVVISAPIKVFRLDSDRFRNLSDTERSTLNSGAEQYCSGAETASEAAFQVWTEALSGTPFQRSVSLKVQCEHSLKFLVTLYQSYIWNGAKTYPVQCEHSLKIRPSDAAVGQQFKWGSRSSKFTRPLTSIECLLTASEMVPTSYYFQWTLILTPSDCFTLLEAVFFKTRWPIGHIASRAIGQYRIWSTVKRLCANCGSTNMRTRKESKHRQSENNERQSNSIFPLASSCQMHSLSSYPWAYPLVNNLRKQMSHLARSRIN